MIQRTILALGVCGSMLLLGGRAAAQVGETGRITTRSDVTMEIEGANGTSGKKLDAFAKTLGTPLGEVKRCYGELVKAHPEVVGELTVEITLLEGTAKPKVVAPNAVNKLKPMQKCIDRAFAMLDVREVPRPARVNAHLTLTNSAAEFAKEVKDQGAEANKVELIDNADGSVSSHGASLQGEITFDVTSKGPSARESVELVHKSVRDGFPGLFDCRRRASKNGSPEGELVYTLKMSPTAKPTLESKSSTVANERAPICSATRLKQVLRKGGKGTVTLTIFFHP